MMEHDRVNLEMSEEEIRSKPVEEKLNIILTLSLALYRTNANICKEIYGCDEKRGLLWWVAVLRNNMMQMKWIMYCAGGLLTAVLSLLMAHAFGGK